MIGLRSRIVFLVPTIVCVASTLAAPPATLVVHADQILHPVSPYLSGACIEDVNHEIYGGMYSQLLYGESFAEPAMTQPVAGFTALGGTWSVSGDELSETGERGAQLVSSHPAFTDGTVNVEMFIPHREAGVASLIVRCARATPGIDNFDGYEVSLDAEAKSVKLGRHRHDYHLVKEAPLDVPVGEWMSVTARLKGSTIEVLVNGKSVCQFDDGAGALGAGTVSLRPWQVQNVRYRNLKIVGNGVETAIPFEASKSSDISVSGMWRWLARGSAEGKAAIETDKPFVGMQSQRVTFTQGDGAVGIENQGLNRQGIGIVAGKPYEGYLWVRVDAATPIGVSLQNRRSGNTYAKAVLRATAGGWQRLDFTLTPDTQDTAARFVIELEHPGSVVIGHAFLQPGEWGRFKGLPVRGDVAQGMIDQDIKVLRYGGSMVNAPEYRWKKMIGPRDRRPPYRGNWYPYSSNGWGIMDFLNFCEAADIHGVPDVNVNESPADMADLIEYVNGPTDSEWGKKRAADGHPAPYGIVQIELGNEERVDDAYVAKFKSLATAIWAKDPKIVPVVGDFAYHRPIVDPMHVTGADSRITTLAGQQKILVFAGANHGEVWFDVHIDTDGPGISPSMNALPTYIDAIDKLAGATPHKVVVFELTPEIRHNAALANAHAILSIERDGRLPICTSANGLQVDQQNDNDWNQGLLFFNTSKVWLQPPGYVSQMISQEAGLLLVKSEIANAAAGFEINAKKSEDGKELVLEVLNNSDEEQAVSIRLSGFTPAQSSATIQTLAGRLTAQNTADLPYQITPAHSDWPHHLQDGAASWSFPARSFSTMLFR